MPHWRDVPDMPNTDSPEYFSAVSSSFCVIVENASSQLMRTQPGSSLSLGLVRFMGWYNLSG